MASSIFVGYPSRPELSRETLAAAARKLDRQPDLDVVSWEDLDVTGRLIIDRVLAAISNATVSVFDVTTLNENVMFEVGYAIGSDARIWLVRDTSDIVADRRWQEMGILSTVGYHAYANSDDLVGGYLSERPDLREETFFREAIEPGLDPVSEPMLFYVKGPVPTEAERDITRQVQHQRRAGIRCIVSDYRESSVEQLTWYAYQCYAASAVLLHLARPGRKGAATHNARCALIGGLAKGLGRPLLMVAEEGYASPLDYRNLLFTYESARQVREHVRYWLGRELASAYAEIEKRASEAQQRRLTTELASVRLGEPVAENEADRLHDYFLPTASYREVLAPTTSVFVGRKGTGKTANLLRAADELSQDKRNVLCIIRPSDYDLEGLLRLLREISQRDVQGFLVESIWRYLLLSEIARSVWEEIQDGVVPPAPGSAEWELDVYMRGAGSVLQADFVVRLEETVGRLTEDRVTTIAQERSHIAEALHAGVIRDLVDHLQPVLATKRRVAILVDNLDQAWESNPDSVQLAHLLVGLLTTVNKVSDVLRKQKGGRADFLVSLAVFIRSDIYQRVAGAAREPDKIPVKRLRWQDDELLLQVLEERYISAHSPDTPASELWEKYFTREVAGVPVRKYIAGHVLPRPRDILWFCNAAVDSAVTRRHTVVESADLREAERDYSQYAVESLAVELSGFLSDAEELLYAFAGVDTILGEPEVREIIESARVEKPDATIDALVLFSFLGRETDAGVFTFVEDPAEQRRSEALANAYRSRCNCEPRLQIHPAFRAYLGIGSIPESQQRLNV